MTLLATAASPHHALAAAQARQSSSDSRWADALMAAAEHEAR
jgi:hypothetical protein